jgi:anti-sigma factor RsiW
MVCEAWERGIDRYLDGELPESEIAALEAHLKGCASCATAALSRRELRLAIREAGAAFTPGPAFRARMERAAKGRSGAARSALWLLPLAAALLAGVGLVALRGGREAAGDFGVREAVDLHVTELASTVPPDVVSSDSHTVKPWFEGKLPFTFDLPDLSRSPFELLGGRVVWIDQMPAAHLLFRVRRHRVSVFVLEERRDATPILRDLGPGASARSFGVRSFSDRGLRYVIVADTGQEDLDDLARRLRGIG